MPYRVKGSSVYHKVGSRWTMKQHARSPAKARAAVRLLRGVEHGWRRG